MVVPKIAAHAAIARVLLASKAHEPKGWRNNKVVGTSASIPKAASTSGCVYVCIYVDVHVRVRQGEVAALCDVSHQSSITWAREQVKRDECYQLVSRIAMLEEVVPVAATASK